MRDSIGKRASQGPAGGDPGEISERNADSLVHRFVEDVAACADEWERSPAERRLELLLGAFFESPSSAPPKSIAELIVSASILSDESHKVEPVAFLRRAALAETRFWDLLRTRGAVGPNATWADVGSAMPPLLGEDPDLLWAPSVLFEIEVLLSVGAAGPPEGDDQLSARARDDLRRLAEELDLSKPSLGRSKRKKAATLSDAQQTRDEIEDDTGFGGTAQLALRLVKRCRSVDAARRVLAETDEWAGLYPLAITREHALSKGIRPGPKHIEYLLLALRAFRWRGKRNGPVSWRNVAAALLWLSRSEMCLEMRLGHRLVQPWLVAREAVSLRQRAEQKLKEERRAARRRCSGGEIHPSPPTQVESDEPESPEATGRAERLSSERRQEAHEDQKQARTACPNGARSGRPSRRPPARDDAQAGEHPPFQGRDHREGSRPEKGGRRRAQIHQEGSPDPRPNPLHERVDPNVAGVPPRSEHDDRGADPRRVVRGRRVRKPP